MNRTKSVTRTIGTLYAILACLTFQACDKKNIAEKKECGDMTFSQMTVLQVDTLLYSQIADFVPIDSSSYVLTDGVSICITDSMGVVSHRISSQGHGHKEYIKIGKLFSDGRNIYAWCDMSLHLYKYDMSLNFIDKYQGPDCAVRRMAVLDGKTACYQLSGGTDEVVCIMPLSPNTKMRREGCYTFEDKALLFNSVSGGIACYDKRMMYVCPSEMTIYTADSGERWEYEDKDFLVNPVTNSLESQSQEETLDYLLKNSTCSGLYADGDYLWLITETGFLELGKDGQLHSDNRFLNVYKIGKDGSLLSSYKYNYPKGIRYTIGDGYLHVLIYDGSTYTVKRHRL